VGSGGGGGEAELRGGGWGGARSAWATSSFPTPTSPARCDSPCFHLTHPCPGTWDHRDERLLSTSSLHLLRIHFSVPLLIARKFRVTTPTPALSAVRREVEHPHPSRSVSTPLSRPPLPPLPPGPTASIAHRGDQTAIAVWAEAALFVLPYLLPIMRICTFIHARTHAFLNAHTRSHY
jgi:hypothetical protein